MGKYSNGERVVVKIAICFIIFFKYASAEESITISNFLYDYDLKVNRSEDSCKWVNHANLPEDRRTLIGRNCMCDEDCVEYKDCCKDTRYYDESEQKQSSPYRCSDYAGVYMITKCQRDWNDSAIAELCEKSAEPLESNVSLVIPVSNPLARITYGNQFCALCNEEDTDSLIWWDVGAVCGKAPPGLLKNSTSPSTTASPFYFFRKNPRKPVVDYWAYLNETEKISSYAVYDSIDKEFVSRYNGSEFVCKFEAVAPIDFYAFTRVCVPFVVKNCPENIANRTLAEQCLSYTNIVYNKFTKQPYKNKECALCSGEKEDDIDGFPRDVRKSVLVAALFGPTAVPGFHVKPMHGLSHATIVPSSDGYIYRLKPNALFKPAG